MTMKKESPARGEANDIIGSLVTSDNSKNPQQTQRFYWSRATHSVQPYEALANEVLA